MKQDFDRLRRWQNRITALADEMRGHGHDTTAEHLEFISADLQADLEECTANGPIVEFKK